MAFLADPGDPRPPLVDAALPLPFDGSDWLPVIIFAALLTTILALQGPLARRRKGRSRRHGGFARQRTFLPLNFLFPGGSLSGARRDEQGIDDTDLGPIPWRSAPG